MPRSEITKSFERHKVPSSKLDDFERRVMRGESLLQVLQVIYDMFVELMTHIEAREEKPARIRTELEDSQTADEKYSSLEKLLQKYEKQIREHIRVEQQLKIYAENMQEGAAEKEKLFKESICAKDKLIEELEKKIAKADLKAAETANENKVLKEMLRSFHVTTVATQPARSQLHQRDSQESLRESLLHNKTEIVPRRSDTFRSNPRTKSREVSPLMPSKSTHSKKRTIFMGNVEKAIKSKQGISKGLLVNFKKLCLRPGATAENKDATLKN